MNDYASFLAHKTAPARTDRRGRHHRSDVNPWMHDWQREIVVGRPVKWSGGPRSWADTGLSRPPASSNGSEGCPRMGSG